MTQQHNGSQYNQVHSTHTYNSKVLYYSKQGIQVKHQGRIPPIYVFFFILISIGAPMVGKSVISLSQQPPNSSWLQTFLSITIVPAIIILHLDYCNRLVACPSDPASSLHSEQLGFSFIEVKYIYNLTFLSTKYIVIYSIHTVHHPKRKWQTH